MGPKRKKKGRRSKSAERTPSLRATPVTKARSDTGNDSPKRSLTTLIAVAVVASLAIVGVVSWFRPLPEIEGNGSGGPDLASPADSAEPIADDPTTDGWDTEAFSQAALAQLKSLGKWLESQSPLASKPDDEAKPFPSGIVEVDLACTALRPQPLSEVLSAQGLIVRRPAETFDDTNQRPTRDFAGQSGLTKAWSGLARVLSATGSADSGSDQNVSAATGSNEVHVHMKIFRVDAGKDRITTDVLFSAEGIHSHGRAQVQAIWRCGWSLADEEGKPPGLASIDVISHEEVAVQEESTWQFVDCTEAVLGNVPAYRSQLLPGIDSWLEETSQVFNRVRWGDQGLALGDVNGDQLDDVYLCEPGGLPNRLLIRQPDGTLQDATAESGADWYDHSRSALLIDVDNDGDQDLVVGTSAALLIMENDGRGHFQLRATHREVVDAHSLAAADFDRDGRLDIYACVYGRERYAPDEYPLPLPYHDAENGGRNVLLRSEDQWKFRDVTDEVGLDQNNHRWSLAAAWADYDDDGDLDLYVANDFGRNCLFKNTGGQFRDVAADAGVEDVGSGMSVDWADYDGDGKLDLYISNMFSTAGSRIAYQQKFKPDASESVRAAYQRLAKGSTLFRNRGDGTFEDVSNEARVARARWAWGAVFADINNDTWDDLIVANGFLTQQDTRDL